MSGRSPRVPRDFGGQNSAGRALVATAWPLRVRLEEPRLVRKHDCLHAVAEVELVEDVRDVCLDGGLADVELEPDLCILEATSDQAKDLSFTLTEIV